MAVALFLARDVPARAAAIARGGVDTAFCAGAREARVASWASSLDSIEVFSPATRAREWVRLYTPDGEIDEGARAAFERVASRDPEPHKLAVRLEQLVFKAAYHFGAPRVLVVSGWRARAGRHGSGDALDFRLEGVRARDVSAYLDGLPRVGVGLYTNPDTQFVHLDVRDVSYHWLDASAPGVHGRERMRGDPRAAARDASYRPDLDLP